MKMLKVLFVALTTFFSSMALSEENISVKIRPHIGIGVISYPDSQNTEIISHVGGRVLLRASDIRSYGLEVTRFSSKSGKTFVSSGIVLEQRLFGWFNMAIGTIGYFNYKGSNQNPVGLTLNLGWEPKGYKSVSPFVSFKSDFIFSEGTTSIQSVSFGLAW